MDSKRHLHGGFTFKIEKADNESFIASITQHERKTKEDNVGALYYVVVVILIYGCSILMMIASYIRKNKVDQRLNRYFKDMATVRKREEQMQLFNAATVAAALQNSRSSVRSTDLTPSPRSSQGDDRSQPGSRQGGALNKDREHNPYPGKAVSNRRTSMCLAPPANRRHSSAFSTGSGKQRPSRTNSVRFVNEQSDLDSDNDVFLSTDNGCSLKTPSPSPTSLKQPSPSTSPFLSPHRTVLSPLEDKPEDSDNDTTSRSRQSSITDTDQQSMDAEQSPLVGNTSSLKEPESNHSQQERRNSNFQSDYQVVSTV